MRRRRESLKCLGMNIKVFKADSRRMLRLSAELGVDVRAAYGKPPYFSAGKNVIFAENH